MGSVMRTISTLERLDSVAHALRMGRAVLFFSAVLCASSAIAQPLRIGDINSYSHFPGHLEPYRKGWRLAEEEINGAGGVNGRRIEVLSVDDSARADEALRHAEDLVAVEKVDVLMGGFTSSVSVALAEFAQRHRVVYLAAGALTDELAGPTGNRYTFTLRPSGRVQASALLGEAVRMRKKRWAIVYPHNMYSYSAIESFRTRLMDTDHGVDAVFEQTVALGAIDAWGVVLWMEENRVQAVLSFLFGEDLKAFIGAAREVGLLEHLQVLNVLAGQPENLAFLDDHVPEGWWVTGYPAAGIDYGDHPRFAAQYRSRWGEDPAAGSLYGYTALIAIAHALRRAQSGDAEKLVAVFERLRVPSPIGMLQWRKDRRSTLGTFVGQLSNNGEEPAMVRWRYESSLRHLPPES
jgi:branched-chain amino acid transport system substrate-binding protein